MIKKIWLVALLLTVMATAAYATPDRVGKTDIGLNVSGAIPRDGDTDTAIYVGGSVAYGVTDWLALGIEAGWAEFSDSGSGANIDKDAFPVFGDIILRVPTQSEVKPYGVVGLGTIFWNVSSNDSNGNVDINTAFAAKFGAGVDWFVNDNWAINFEASYVFSDADAKRTDTVAGFSITSNQDTDYWMIGGGIKYLFS